MNLEITTEELSDCLRFQIRGVESSAESIEYWSIVAKECNQRGYTKALVIEEHEGQLSVVDMNLVCEQLPSILQGLTVAYVDTDPDHLSLNKFGEDVVVIEGRQDMRRRNVKPVASCQARVFSTEEDARRWLQTT